MKYTSSEIVVSRFSVSYFGSSNPHQSYLTINAKVQNIFCNTKNAFEWPQKHHYFMGEFSSTHPVSQCSLKHHVVFPFLQHLPKETRSIFGAGIYHTVVKINSPPVDWNVPRHKEDLLFVSSLAEQNEKS